MAENFVQLPPNSSGVKIRTEEMTVGANIVDQEIVSIGDPSSSANIATVTGTGALKVDGSAVTQPVSGTLGINNFPATQPISGTVSVTNFANPLPVSESGTWTVQPGNTANTTPWLSTINQGGNSAAVTGSNALKVDNSAVTQPISGTVTSNQGTANATPWNENLAQVGGSVVSLGAKLSASSIPVVLATDQVVSLTATTVAVSNFPASQVVDASQTPILVRDSVGEDLYGTNNALNVHLAGNELLNLDGSGNLGVNVQGTVPISAPAPLSITGAISGSVTVSNLPTIGPQPSSASTSVVLATDIQPLDDRIHDSVGEDLYGTNNALNVHLAGNEIFNTDGVGNLGVNVQGTVPVSVIAPLPVSISSTLLEPNAAQESGGNLALDATSNQFNPQIVDLLKLILAQLQVLNMNFSSYSSFVGAGTIDDQDAISNTFIQ